MITEHTSTTITRFATPEQIERNHARLVRLGDRGRTGNLFAAEEAEERERQEAARREEEERRACGLDLPLFAGI